MNWGALSVVLGLVVLGFKLPAAFGLALAVLGWWLWKSS